MFRFNKKDSGFIVKLNIAGSVMKYCEVTGFFEFRGEVYYRAKGVSARNLYDVDKSFTEKIKELYPEEFCNVKAVDISNLLVQPLKAVK